MKQKQIEALDSVTLLEKYAVGFGKLALDANNDNLKNSVTRMHNELLKRLDPYDKVDRKKLYELLADETVVNDRENFDEVAAQLISHIKSVVGLGECDDNTNIIVAIDHSGSMGTYEKYSAKVFMTWIEKILNEKYKNIQNYYVSFSTTAKVSEEYEAYGFTEVGGTIVSSGLHKVNEIINNYDYEATDTYVFLISDGDNLTSDNDRVGRLIKDISRKATKVTYLEINQYNRHSTLIHGLKKLEHPDNFNSIVIKDHSEILELLEMFCEKI